MIGEIGEKIAASLYVKEFNEKTERKRQQSFPHGALAPFSSVARKKQVAWSLVKRVYGFESKICRKCGNPYGFSRKLWNFLQKKDSLLSKAKRSTSFFRSREATEKPV